jgi:multiple sugar transport system ATP-binding protein
VDGFLGNPPMNFLPSRIIANGSRLFVEVGNLKLPVPESKRKQYEHLAGREVIFGIRPEHIHEKTAKIDCPPGTVVSARVDLIEPLGSETLLNMTTGNYRFIGKTLPLSNASLHEEIEIFIDMDEMHIFEKDGEQLRVKAEKEDLSNLSHSKRV